MTTRVSTRPTTRASRWCPTAEMPWYRVTWDISRAEMERGTFKEHAPLVEELLDRIRADGPLSSTDVEPRAAIDWYWRPTNQVRALLEALAAGRHPRHPPARGQPSRLRPSRATLPRGAPGRAPRRRRAACRTSCGPATRPTACSVRAGQAEVFLGTGMGRRPAASPSDELIDAGELIEVDVEGVREPRFIVPATSRLPGRRRTRASPTASRRVAVAPGVAFLAPLDPLVWDRELLRTLFDFDYVWEVYVPAAKRRWGYYVLPLLFGDRLVGRIEPRVDRAGGALRILDIWWEDGFDPLALEGFVDAFVEALRAHARFVGVDRIVWPRVARHRALGAAVRDRLGRPGAVRVLTVTYSPGAPVAGLVHGPDTEHPGVAAGPRAHGTRRGARPVVGPGRRRRASAGSRST